MNGKIAASIWRHAQMNSNFRLDYFKYYLVWMFFRSISIATEMLWNEEHCICIAPRDGQKNGGRRGQITSATLCRFGIVGCRCLASDQKDRRWCCHENQNNFHFCCSLLWSCIFWTRKPLRLCLYRQLRVLVCCFTRKMCDAVSIHTCYFMAWCVRLSRCLFTQMQRHVRAIRFANEYLYKNAVRATNDELSIVFVLRYIPSRTHEGWRSCCRFFVAFVFSFVSHTRCNETRPDSGLFFKENLRHCCCSSALHIDTIYEYICLLYSLAMERNPSVPYFMNIFTFATKWAPVSRKKL